MHMFHPLQQTGIKKFGFFSAIATGSTIFDGYEMEICNKQKGIAKDVHYSATNYGYDG